MQLLESNAAGGPAMDDAAARRLRDMLLDLPNMPTLTPLVEAIAPDTALRRTG